MSVPTTQPVSEANTQLPTRTQPVDPKRNPSYPQRIHAGERAYWMGVLQSCEQRIATARRKLDVLGATPSRPAFERLYAQMLGARDQVADAAKRLSMETGDLYAEDRHRLEEAVAALDRVLKLWESQKA